MASTLVVETGSGVNPLATSYADLAFIRAYQAARGRAYTSGDVADAIADSQAILAMDYLASLEGDMQGSRVFGADQPLAFPRDDVYLYGELLANDEIPLVLMNAQAELVWQIKAGVNLFPTVQGAQVKRRKTGPLETEWFAPGEAPAMPAVMAWLGLLLNESGMSLRVVRI